MADEEDKDKPIIDLEQERIRRATSVGARLLRKIEQARAHPRYLYELIFRGDRGEPVTVKWFHEEWFELFMQNRSLMLEAPRGTGKTVWVVCIILWLLGHNQELRIKLVCENDAKAKKRLRAIRDVIEQSDVYRLIFPNVKLDKHQTNDKHTLNLVRGRISTESTIEARGIETAGSGDRADILIGDDICGMRNTISKPALREDVKQTFLSDWLPTINPRDGRVILIFTPWHEEDLNHHLKRTSEYAYKRYAHGRPNDEYYSIFPELFSSARLKQERTKMGAAGYARAYLCVALHGDVVLVNADWLKPYTQQHLLPEWLKGATCILSVDPSSGRKAHKGELDYAGFTVFLVLPQELTGFGYTLILVTESFHTRASTAQQVCLISELCRTWRPSEILVEAQGMQNLDEWIEREKATNPQYWPQEIIPIPATQAKGQRLQSITPLMDTPDGVPPYVRFHPQILSTTQESFFKTLSDGSRVECERALRYQLVNFPTKYDDNMDSCTQGLNYIRTFHFPLEGDQAESEASMDSAWIPY